MNSRLRRTRYRSGVYRKKRIQIILATACGVLAVTFITLVILGNILGNKVEQSLADRPPSSAESQPFVHGEIRKVKAYPTPLFVEGTSQLSNRVKSTAAKGYTDACFELDSADGTVFYRSDVAISLGYQEQSTDMRKLPDAVKLFKDNGLYTVGIMRMSEFSSDNDLKRTAAMGYYSARAAEALRAGVDDVLLCPGDIPAEQYIELIELADEVHRLCPDGSIGIAIFPSILKNEENSELIDKLWRAFDYLAADVSSPADANTDAAEYVSSELGSMLYFLLRYELRVLAPSVTTDADAQRIIDAVKQSGSQNVMIMP